MELTDQILQECLTVRKKCALFDHPNRGIIEVHGKDRVQFLHNILSNDIKHLSPGTGVPACLLNAQAHVIANLNVLAHTEFLWLAFDYALKERLFQELSKLIIAEQVELKDQSEELKLISVHGPKAKEVLERAFNEKLPDHWLDHKNVVLDRIPSTCVRINLTGETGFGFLIPKPRSIQFRMKLEEKVGPFELVPIQATTLETLRIEAGIPRYGIDFDESHIPLECRLDASISFTKGCFPGQEILARLDSRGGVQKKLVGLTLKGETAPEKNDRIAKDRKEVGRITSAVFSPTLKKTIAMGYLKKECWKIGCPVVVETGGTEIPARVASLPFYAPHAA